MGNIEEECEDAVFEICDIRERYPAHCAKKLGQCLRLTNEINTTNIKVDSIHIHPLEIPLKETDEKVEIFKKFESSLSKVDPNLRRNSKNMLEDLNSLITVAHQLRSEKYCDLYKCLKKINKERNMGENSS
ncbi:uncharacterized protein LOC117172645 isoform X2 [Belonocnema kinseyi]|uniref:uncharacterized protein LOC117172645 isoform X2 n=1 Tax=Belonocnema kinseyi TaxID=2817044 RepID=UPI00143D132A|nr:uncharacterized protein LOC117172645 isoform X2 [Belonocnema kinseyi]